MRAGKIRTKISLHKPTITQNSTTGEVIQTMSTYIDNRWAEVVINQGSEQFINDERHFRKELIATMRYSTGIVPTMKILYPSSGSTVSCYYDIIGIQDVNERHRELIITAEKYD